MLQLTPAHREQRGLDARRRIVQKFDLDAVTRTYEQLYIELAACQPPALEAPMPELTAAGEHS